MKLWARIKGAWKSKTIMFNYLIMLIGIAQTIIPETSMAWAHQAWILLVIGSVGMVLRFVTTDDLADK